jgi:hypothetical protein
MMLQPRRSHLQELELLDKSKNEESATELAKECGAGIE